MAEDKAPEYQGFEQGPIRPPSEASSLLIRVTRNCPWNRCTFCPVYKGSRFSQRPVEHVIADIDAVHESLAGIFKASGGMSGIPAREIAEGVGFVPPDRHEAFYAALSWYLAGMESVFLQDANSLIIKPQDLIRILRHLRVRFPWVKRVTSYARSRTVARIKPEDLSAMADAGLNRIHIGMESGSDKVLARVCKGVTKADHVTAGQKVKQAKMELSEYVMPGLGGRDLSSEHARQTADALNRINPDFIRLRTLAVPPGTPLFEEFSAGSFELCPEVMVVEEILLFLQNLKGVTAMVKSDHILNLLEGLEGRLPEDKEAMENVARSFLALNPKDRTVYQVGRRMGLFGTIAELKDSHKVAQAESVISRLGITPENADNVLYQLMQRFI
jgi:hypothetical protein